ncbi:MAG: APC family permease [Xanthobacteraceae bacterium]|nr:APC family permease [Xanthobacteraceae bacterium]
MYDVTLRKNCLGFVELLAQGIALISPTMTAALIIPVMYGNTGDWSWLSYALGTIMLVFVAFNLNQFARRSATAGSMYLYICRGLGISAGAIGGWSLIWAYLGISMAGVTGFSIFADKLLEMVGFHLPFSLLFAVCVGISWFCAWKNVQLSAILMLILEGASMLLIAILCIVTLAQHGFKIDHAQFDVSTLPLSGLGLGVVVAIFSLVGFECCTAFGEEARDPLVTIPKAVVWSLVISGSFFVFVSYVMVMATHGSDPTLDKIDAPLNVMATLAHLPILQAPLSFGAMVSFFALCLSCINAGSRVLFAMGRHGLFHAATADSHETNATPHVAVTTLAAIAFIIPTVSVAVAGLEPLDLFNYVGTLAAFGFIVPYIMITIAAPVYLKKIGELRNVDLAVCGVALALLMIPTVGSVYPIPDAPVLYFPYLFLAYLAIGAVWILSVRFRKPLTAAMIKEHVGSILPAAQRVA